MRSTGDSRGEQPAEEPDPGIGPDAPASDLGSAGELPAGPGFVGFQPAEAAVASVEAGHAAVVAVRTLAALDVDSLSDDECLGVFDDLELVRRSLGAVAGRLSAALQARGVCDARYGMTIGTWFERRHGRSRQSVAREARTAKRLASMPLLESAMARGEISVERAELIVSKVNDRNSDALVAAQDALLALSASEPSFSQFAVLVTDLARFADADGGHDPEPGRSRVSARRTGEEVVVGGTFVGVEGASFEELLESATNRLWRRYRDDRRECPELVMPSRTELRAEALLELVRRGASVEVGAAKRPVAELSLIVEPADVPGSDPEQEGFLRSPEGWDVSTPAGVPVRFSPGDWELLCCGAHVSELRLDAGGRFVACRETERGPSRAQRRALEARDGGCVFPGCECPPAWCDAHHVVPYSDDGPTVLCNMVLLCRHHHGVAHRKGWTINASGSDDGQADGWFTITTARGLTMSTRHRHGPSSRHGPSG